MSTPICFRRRGHTDLLKVWLRQRLSCGLRLTTPEVAVVHPRGWRMDSGPAREFAFVLRLVIAVYPHFPMDFAHRTK